MDTYSNETRFFPADKSNLQVEYDKYLETRHLIVNELKELIETVLSSLDSNPVVNGRIKSFTSYFSKYLRLLKEGAENPRITDLLGIRIICPFIEDLAVAEELINKNFRIIEHEVKGHFSFREFGYESTHLLIEIPESVKEKYGDPAAEVFEVQIRTILQDAWAEVEHELVYKVEFSPFGEPMKRKLAAVNASLSLADIIFQEIRSYQRNYSIEMGKRRKSFFQKIEESTDGLLFEDRQDDKNGTDTDDSASINDDYASLDYSNINIDDMLVDALTAHNENRFNEAISQYTKILTLKPEADGNNDNSNSDEMIRSIIFKHRGMAYFACSQYNEAINDFSASLALDSQSYKAAYYRGVVHSVMKQYSEALDDYTLSLSINPYQPFCLFKRGQIYYHIGDYPQGLADCENSLALEPNNKSAQKFKEILHQKLRM